MIVYIVRGYWDYEGSRILGVYLTEIEADRRVRSLREGQYQFDRYGYDETTVGEECSL